MQNHIQKKVTKMSNFVIVLGESGSGKSTSIKSLNPKETCVFNILGKRLPFKGSASAYNVANNNLFQISDWQQVIDYLTSISTNAPHIKNVVLDDAIYIMRTEFFNRAKEKGYDKYNELADHFRRIIATCGSLRDDLNIFMLLHVDTVESDGSVVGYRSSSVGKLLEKLYKPEENTAITLFAQPRFDDKGVASYGFYTHKLKVGGIELPSKTPEGMFEEDYIPNDLGLVVKAMNDYYNG